SGLIGARSGCVALALAASAWLGAAHASADEPKRAVPDYDGRGSPPTTAGDVALWVPRIVFSPLYLTSEFVIRRPLGALISAAERARVPSALYDFFTFGPEHKAGFAPVAFIDFGFNPSVGIYAFWDDAFAAGNDLRFHGSTWGSDWLAGSLTDRIHLHGKDTLALNVTGVRRPDSAFFGLGPRTLEGDISRYGEDRVDGSAAFDLALWRASRVQTKVGLKTVSLYHGHYGSDPSLEQQVAGGVFPQPYGFDRGYTAEYNHFLAALDSRLPRPANGSGVRLELDADQGNDVRRSPGSGWVRYGATAGAFYDLNDHGRVMSLSVASIFADPLGGQPIPFPELVTLGGDAPMPGFFPGRLYDRSAAVATLQYRWPVAPFVDGAMQGAVGNVFGEHLEGFEPRLLRFSAALGIATVGSPDSSIEILFGVGTETFEHGGQPDSVRVMLGTNRF
ncbi:MAG TPA: hypothetical protein VIF09_20410, partial [Polyangiaceae bacterium]